MAGGKEVEKFLAEINQQEGGIKDLKHSEIKSFNGLALGFLTYSHI